MVVWREQEGKEETLPVNTHVTSVEIVQSWIIACKCELDHRFCVFFFFFKAALLAKWRWWLWKSCFCLCAFLKKSHLEISLFPMLLLIFYYRRIIKWTDETERKMLPLRAWRVYWDKIVHYSLLQITWMAVCLDFAFTEQWAHICTNLMLQSVAKGSIFTTPDSHLPCGYPILF